MKLATTRRPALAMTIASVRWPRRDDPRSSESRNSTARRFASSRRVRPAVGRRHRRGGVDEHDHAAACRGQVGQRERAIARHSRSSASSCRSSYDGDTQPAEGRVDLQVFRGTLPEERRGDARGSAGFQEVEQQQRGHAQPRRQKPSERVEEGQRERMHGERTTGEGYRPGDPAAGQRRPTTYTTNRRRVRAPRRRSGGRGGCPRRRSRRPAGCGPRCSRSPRRRARRGVRGSTRGATGRRRRRGPRARRACGSASRSRRARWSGRPLAAPRCRARRRGVPGRTRRR